jgi:ElaB/YqjD/DUF883 family membrane-anchored ribosome-binding protein
MSLSPRARAAASKLKTFSADDVQSISEMIKHEVHHATDLVAERARQAEARIRQLTENAGDDFSRLNRTATQKIREHPLQSSLIALGLGLAIGLLLAATKR